MICIDLCMEEREEIVDIHIIIMPEETTGMVAILSMTLETHGIAW